MQKKIKILLLSLRVGVIILFVSITFNYIQSVDVFDLVSNNLKANGQVLDSLGGATAIRLFCLCAVSHGAYKGVGIRIKGKVSCPVSDAQI